MAMPTWAKALVGASLIGPVALFGASKLWHHLHHGHHHHGKHHRYEHSKCVACLADGQDFCISENRCTPRATFTCRGPEDHITGDKEFALHGNPNVQHAMVCPADHHDSRHGHYHHQPCRAAKEWCVGKEGGKIYEGKCKKLWNECAAGEEEKKDGGWARCAIAKVKCMRDGVKVLDGRCGEAWEKCGEEVRAHSGEKKEIDTEGWAGCAIAKTKCMKDGVKVLDGRCGAAWEKCGEEVRAHGWAGCAIAKTKCMKDGVKVLDGRCSAAWEKCGEEVRAHSGEKKEIDTEGWASCAIAKTKCMKDGVKVLDGRCGEAWEKCGEEVRAHSGEKKEIDTKDCYFDPECHKKVDWAKVGKTKSYFFPRLRHMRNEGQPSKVKNLITHAHQHFAEAGVPEDRIDYILRKWVRFGYPEAFEAMAEAKGDGEAAKARKERTEAPKVEALETLVV